MELIEAIEQWDGKSTDYLVDVFEEHCSREEFASDLVDLAAVPELQTAATWLLKHHFEQDGSLDSELQKDLFRGLQQLEHWGAKLHVLQIFDRLTIRAAERKPCKQFLAECLESENKFVRAWTMHGYHTLATQHTEYQESVTKMLQDALETEAASVKARVRKLLKAGF